MDFTLLLRIIKTIGKEAVMELVKSKWIQFSIGAGIIMMSAPGFIHAVAEIVK